MCGHTEMRYFLAALQWNKRFCSIISISKIYLSYHGNSKEYITITEVCFCPSSLLLFSFECSLKWFRNLYDWWCTEIKWMFLAAFDTKWNKCCKKRLFVYLFASHCQCRVVVWAPRPCWLHYTLCVWWCCCSCSSRVVVWVLRQCWHWWMRRRHRPPVWSH